MGRSDQVLRKFSQQNVLNDWIYNTKERTKLALIPTFWPEQQDGWNCHQLRWEISERGRFDELDQEFSLGLTI